MTYFVFYIWDWFFFILSRVSIGEERILNVIIHVLLFFLSHVYYYFADHLLDKIREMFEKLIWNNRQKREDILKLISIVYMGTWINHYTWLENIYFFYFLINYILLLAYMSLLIAQRSVAGISCIIKDGWELINNKCAARCELLSDISEMDCWILRLPLGKDDRKRNHLATSNFTFQ